MTRHTLPGPGSWASWEFGAPGWVRGRVKVTEVTYPGGQGRSEEGEASSWGRGGEQGRELGAGSWAAGRWAAEKEVSRGTSGLRAGGRALPQ